MDGRENTDCHTAEQGWVGAMAMVEVMATTIGKQEGRIQTEPWPCAFGRFLSKPVHLLVAAVHFDRFCEVVYPSRDRAKFKPSAR